MSQEAVQPFLITKNEEGRYRLTVRHTRYNSQGYPIVTSDEQQETFPTIAAAKAFARDTYHARPGEFARK